MPPSTSAAAAAEVPTTTSTTAGAAKTTVALPTADMNILDDVADLKWKIYGKNMYFSILFEATVKIQAFWRGALCRAKTAQRIEAMIDRILKTRQQAAKDAEEWERYRQQDLLERRQRQQEELNGDDDDVLLQLLPPGSTQRKSTRTGSVYKPWKPVQEPFAELLATTSGNKKIREQLEEKEETSMMAVINSNSSVEVLDMGMSVKERLKMWEPSSTQSGIQRTSSIENQRCLDIDTSANGKFCADDDDDMDGDTHTKDSTTVHSEDASNQSFTTTSTIGITNVSTTARYFPQRSISKVAAWQVDVDAKSDTNSHNNSHDSDDREKEDELDLIANLETMFMEESVSSAAPEPGGKGYSRYRTETKGKNKHRPWRDDTNVFDAY